MGSAYRVVRRVRYDRIIISSIKKKIVKFGNDDIIKPRSCVHDLLYEKSMTSY